MRCWWCWSSGSGTWAREGGEAGRERAPTPAVRERRAGGGEVRAAPGRNAEREGFGPIRRAGAAGKPGAHSARGARRLARGGFGAPACVA